MKIADLYIRVSTDEQADKGYSQRNQEEMLRKYCSVNYITVRKVIYEDHSAKTFNRPQWKVYLLDLKRYKGKSDLVLFLKWDRFSRNAGDAYQMINTLRKLGVEPQAIEQPLDMSVPENKMMLAFYLAAPEVENDRRALNVIAGMRRAIKEGRFMGKAPYGYVNKSDENGNKYIAIQEPMAGIIRWSYEQLAKGIYNIQQVYEMAQLRGFNGARSLFWFAIRNPVYCSKVFLPKHKDEESRYVKAKHEPIVSEALFYEVQDILSRRKRISLTTVRVEPSLPLRGFLICPECKKVLSGSISKGNTKRYAYYHCYNGCNYRRRADLFNLQFVSQLSTYRPKKEILDAFLVTLHDAWLNQTSHLYQERSKITNGIKELNDKLEYLAELLMAKRIEPEDYRNMKSMNAVKIDKLNSQLAKLNSEKIDIEQLLQLGIENLLKLDYAYEIADIDKKREIIAAVCPDKLEIENGSLRTVRVNEVVRVIWQKDNELQGNKKGQNRSNSVLSSKVVLSGQFSNHFLGDLKILVSEDLVTLNRNNY